jgi:D-alanyl-D-alanine dipeptidase
MNMPTYPLPGGDARLVQIARPSIVVSLAYATPQNFTGQVLYDDSRAWLHPEAADALYRAADSIAATGLRLVLLDAFRPISVQHALWAIRPDPEFVADPAIGSDHSKGIAVDVTLADASCVLDMGTDFDAAVPQSHHDRSDISAIANDRRFLLRKCMTAAGFQENPMEWWHYALTDGHRYPRIDHPQFADAAILHE